MNKVRIPNDARLLLELVHGSVGSGTWINADCVVEKGKERALRVLKEDGKSEGAKLWSLKAEKDGVCTGCGGKRVAARS